METAGNTVNEIVPWATLKALLDNEIDEDSDARGLSDTG